MKAFDNRLFALCLVISSIFISEAKAQWHVIDEPAIAQLIKEFQTLQQQLAIARQQLQSATQALQSMKGDRGMELLLGGYNRNYLPTTWSTLTNAAQGHGLGEYTAFANDIQNAMTANAVLTPQRLATLSFGNRQQIQAARQSNAMQQALAQEALANASGRFVGIQSLIAAISTASDQKAILDLQARINAELGMLQNEQTKLQVLFQATQAQESAVRQQVRERVIDGQGRFESRLQPTP